MVNDIGIMLNPESPNAENTAKWISEHMDARTDPASKTPGAPPLYGQDAVPHLLTFQSIVGSFSRAYVNPDEAMRDSIENAHLMEKDVGLLESVECRQRLTALLDWEIKPEDEKCQYQVSLAQELQRIISRIRHFTKYRMWLMKAIWSGRSGIQHKYGYTRVNGSLRMMPTPLHRDHNGWMPVNGDKLIFRYEDGRNYTDEGAYPHQMGIKVGTNPGNADLRIHRKYKLDPVADGLALFLKPYERDTFCVHKHFIEDADFHHSFFAGSVHGVGIRSKIYWEWFLKQEAFAFLMQYLERSAGGIEVWTYPMGDPKALAATQKAAREKMANGRNIVFFPKPMGDDSESYKFEIIEPGAMGLDIMQNIIENYFGGRLKRYILGQELSTEAKATGMGSGVAEAHMDTLSQIIKFDARNLEETLTHELVRYIQQLNFPETLGWHMRMSLKTEDDKTQERMDALNAAYQMGASIAESEVFRTLGLSAPAAGEKILSITSQQQPMMPPGMDQMAAMLGGDPAQDDLGGIDTETGEDIPDGGDFPEEENTGELETEDPMELIQSLLGQYAAERKRERYATQRGFNWDATVHPREASAHGTKQPGQFAPKNTGIFGKASPQPQTAPQNKAISNKIRSLFAEHVANHEAAQHGSSNEGIFGKAQSTARSLPTLNQHGKFIKSKTEDESRRDRLFEIANKGTQPVQKQADPPRVETVPHPSPKADAAVQPQHDNAVVNLPIDKRGSGSLDQQIDRWKTQEQASKQAKRKTDAAEFKDNKSKARELFEQHANDLAQSTSNKHGVPVKDALHQLDQLVKWEPDKAVHILESWVKENAQPAPQPEPQRRRMAGHGADAQAVAPATPPVIKTQQDSLHNVGTSEQVQTDSQEPKTYRQVVQPEEEKPASDNPERLTPEQRDLVNDHYEEHMKSVTKLASVKFAGYKLKDRASFDGAIEDGLIRAAQTWDGERDFLAYAQHWAFINLKNLNPNRRKLNAKLTSGSSSPDDEGDPLANAPDRDRGDAAAEEDRAKKLHEALSGLPENERWLMETWHSKPLKADGSEMNRFDITDAYNEKFNIRTNRGTLPDRTNLSHMVEGIRKKLEAKLGPDLYAVVREYVIRYYRQELLDFQKERYERRQDRTIREAAEYTETDPSDAQIKAGNYKKGRFSWNGMQVVIENPRGSTRRGVSADGEIWKNEMSSHYGYISRTNGNDNDPIDVFMGRHPESDIVFVVHQIDQTTGELDEHKCMLGFTNLKQAKDAYLSHYPKGWKCGEIVPMTIRDFKTWLEDEGCCT